MAKRIVLVVTSTAGGKHLMVESALRVVGQIRRSAAIPLARALDWEVRDDKDTHVEMRELERQLIMNHAVDAIVFTDPAAPDVQELVELARQYGLTDRAIAA